MTAMKAREKELKDEKEAAKQVGEFCSNFGIGEDKELTVAM